MYLIIIKKMSLWLMVKKARDSRTRSGCFFCFYQQKIEWVWLYENKRDKFEEAMKYEKEGFTWMEDESLEELAKPERQEGDKITPSRKQREWIFWKEKHTS
ncbi:MAG: hypothetical protein U5K31_05665 [Balneolaceae bacterium]|nr:hypothetical protein [Balneolaceae bacterium]